MDARKLIVDNFSYQGKFFDCVNSSRNQANLRQINVIQDILKQSEQKSKYQKLLDNIKSKPIYEVLDQSKSTDQELTKQVHTFYSEIQKILPRVINRKRISSNDSNVLKSINNKFDNIQINDRSINVSQMSTKLDNSIIKSSLGNSMRRSRKKLSSLDKKVLKQMKSQISNKNNENSALQTKPMNTDKVQINLPQKKRKIKKSVFHLLSDSDEDSSVCSDRGNFVNEEYDTSNKVFSQDQSDKINTPRSTLDKITTPRNYTIDQSIKLNSINRSNINQKMKTPRHNQGNLSLNIHFSSNAKPKLLTEPDRNHSISLSDHKDTSLYGNNSLLSNGNTRQLQFYDVQEKCDIQKKLNSKFKPQNASLREFETSQNKSELYSRESLKQLNIPQIQLEILSDFKQKRSFSTQNDNTPLFLSGQKSSKNNKLILQRINSSFQQNYGGQSLSIDQQSRFSPNKPIKQNQMDFYYGTISPSHHLTKISEINKKTINKNKNLSTENKKSLYHFDFISDDLSSKMQSEKNSLRTIQKIFEQSQDIQQKYKDTENAFSKIQNKVYDSLSKQCKKFETMNKEFEEDINEYQQLQIHTGLTANQENIIKFNTELRKKAAEVHKEASKRNMQKLKKVEFGISQIKKHNKEFPLQIMPSSIQQNGKFQAMLRENNFN